MKVSVLGIGTELTDGQIVNRNAPWISARLKAAGVSTRLHLVVPDERGLMRAGLELCAAESDVIFVTGGLGPTSDDFTRDVVAEWMNAPLKFHPASWDHLSHRLTSRGYAVKEIQRQQCYFPENAEVLFNTEGTANAFKVFTHGKTVFVLPGPPREIEAIWNSDIAHWLVTATQHLDPVITRIWDTMGRGESDIATLTEEALAGLQGVDIGYRVHLPYVEVKMTFAKSESARMQSWVDKLTEVLAPHTVLRDGADATEMLAKKLTALPSVKFTDTMTGTYLWQRLSVPLRSFFEKKEWSFANRPNNLQAAVELSIEPLGDFGARITVKQNGTESMAEFHSPYKTANMQERAKQFMAEQALLFWSAKIL